MGPTPTQSGVLKFGVFEIDLEARELRKSGMRQKLAGQPFEALRILVEHPQEVVSREELRKRLWPDNTFVDYDLALKKVINRVREVLGDSAENPRFIETIPRKGYRFIAPVSGDGTATFPAVELPSGLTTGPHPSRRNQGIALGLGAAALLLVILGFVSNKFWQRLSGGSVQPPIRSLAVLPLRNLSADPTQEYFSDGMTDALITDLAQIASVKVISRTSSAQYKETKKSLPEIARELNVDGIVEGTVQRSGDRVRITAQLIYGPSDKHVWADSYEGDIRDMFALERDVTERIAHQVRARLTTPNHAPAAQPRPVNPEALEAYLQGNYHLSKSGSGFGDEELRKAQEYFRQAISADPGFAAAYLGMAYAHGFLMRGASEDVTIAETSAKKALELDPTYSDAHGILGWIKFHSFWDWAGAEEELRTAVALNPNSADGHGTLCMLLGSLGRMDEALKECQIAQELDPNQDHLIEILYFRRECDRGIELALRWIDRYPDNGIEHTDLCHCYVLKGMHKEAVQELERTVVLFGLREAAARIHKGFAISGYEGAMRAWAREIEQLASTKEAFLPMNAAVVYADLGDKDRAFYWLEQAYQHRDLVGLDDGLIDIRAEPMLDSLRSDPRYKDLVRRVGLTQ